VTAARRRIARVVGVAAASLAAAAAMYPVTALEVENTAHGRPIRLALGTDESFSVISRHSMYDQPVTEEFVVDARRRIVLTSVSSPSAAVREYFGISDPGERHPMRRAIGEVVFRIAAGPAQSLRAGGAEHSFLEFGEHGDRLVLRAIRRPAVVHWLA